MANGAVLKRAGIDADDRIHIDNLGLIYYDINNDWILGPDDILLGSLVYTSSLARISGIFNQDPGKPELFSFGANIADQGKGLMVIFDERFLKGLSLGPPPPVIPTPVKPAASEKKANLESTLKNKDDISNFIAANLAPSDTISSGNVSVELTADSPSNVVLSGSANIGATGNTSENVLIGNDGDNPLDGGFGNDVLIGGKGNDTYYVDSPDDAVIELRADGSDTVVASTSYVLPDQVENLVLVDSATRGRGSGNAADNVITGNGYANILSGYGGNDILDGQGGEDLLVGGFGNDTYVIDSLGDIIDERFNAGSDTVRIRIGGMGSYDLPKYVENAVLEDGFSFAVRGNDLANSILGNALGNSLWGGRGDDCLSGQDGDDRLIGDFGNDYLDGGAGVDLLEGGLGNDYYIVNSSSDVVLELFAEGQDFVQATCDYTLPANAETLVLVGSSNLAGYGNSLDNLIKGNIGANILDGGSGADTLTGLAGADVFIFSSLSSFSVKKVDHITDFQPGLDVILIGASAFGVASANGFTSSIVRGAAELASAMRTLTPVVYDSSTGCLHWNQNGSIAGSGQGGIFAVLDNKPALGTSDLSFY